MDKSFVKDWFKQEEIIKDKIVPPFDMVLTEFNGNFYPRRTWNTVETKEELDTLNSHGIIPPSEIREIINILLDYCDHFTDEDIEYINNKIREEGYKNFNVEDYYIEPSHYIKKSKCRAGYIYMLRCADKVKIGYSKNVEQRIKQLDVRPFKTELIFKEYRDTAYNIEQIIHKCLEDYKEEGEWYSNKITKELVRDMIEQLDYEIEIVEGK